jgi:hypothetical protein
MQLRTLLDGFPAGVPYPLWLPADAEDLRTRSARMRPAIATFQE